MPAGCSSMPSKASQEVSCDTHVRLQQPLSPRKGMSPHTPQVLWEVNQWESASDQSRPGPSSPDCPGSPGHQQAAQQLEEPSPKRQAVLLPWDMM